MAWANQIRVSYMSEKGGTLHHPLGIQNEYLVGEGKKEFVLLAQSTVRRILKVPSMYGFLRIKTDSNAPVY